MQCNLRSWRASGRRGTKMSNSHFNPKFCDFGSNQVFGKFKQPPLPTATTLVVTTTTSPLASSDSELTSLSLFLQFRFHPQLARHPPRCSVQVVTLNCPVQPTLNSQKLEGEDCCYQPAEAVTCQRCPQVLNTIVY